MRQIKFRGRVPDTDCIKLERGTIRYGALMTFAEGIAGYTHWIIEGYRNYPVDPETVVQLVGYDTDGREVYEGDIVVDELTQEYTAEIYDRPEKIAQLKLKEAHHAV